MKNKRIFSALILLTLLVSLVVFSSCMEKTFTVSFSSNGGVLVSGKEVQTVTKASEIVPPTYEKEGYIFSGWDTIIKGVNEDKKITAEWEAQTFKLYFDAVGGKVSESFLNITYNNPIGELPIPTKEGYVFDSWRKENAEGEIITQGQIFKGLNDIRAVAKWIVDEAKVFTITYDMNGATLPQNNPTSYRVIDGDILLENPSKVGYIFVGWKEAKDSSPSKNRVIKSGTTGNLTFTAVFKEMKFEINYNLSFVTPKGSNQSSSVFGKDALSSIYVSYGTNIENYVYDFTPNSNYFKNKRWVYLNEGREVTVDKKLSITLENFPSATLKTDKAENYYSIEFTAKYDIDFDIVFNGNGGTLISGKETFNVENVSEVSLPVYIRPGYTFDGFDKLVSSIAGNTVVNAKWSPNKYQINFDANGGNVDCEFINVYYNGIIGELPVPTKEGSIFGGWKVSSEDGGSIYQGQVYNRLSDINAVAKWIIDDNYSYVITYNLNGGELSENNPETYKSSDEDIILKNPSKEGHIFLGWREDKEETLETEKKILSGSIGNKLFTAEYKKMDFVINYCLTYTTAKNNTVISKVNGESQIEDVVLKYGDSIEGYLYEFTPLVEQYKNCAWVYSKSGIETVINDSFRLTKNSFTTAEIITTEEEPYYYVTIFAKSDISYMVTYNGNGGTHESGEEIQIVETSDEIVEPTYIREGYTFIGFDKEKTEIKKDTIVKASWVANTYKITFDANTGEVDTTSINVSYDSALGILPIPTKIGYVFDGWRKESENGEVVSKGEIYKIPSDITLVAKWNPDEGAQFTISYNMNGANLPEGIKTIYKVIDEDFTLINPTKKGYLFIGWQEAHDLEPKIDYVIEKGTAGNLHFTAVFKALKFEINYQLVYETPSRTITSKINDSISVNPIVVDYDSEIENYLYEFVPDDNNYKNKCWIYVYEGTEYKVENCFKATTEDFLCATIKYDTEGNPYYSVTIIAKYYASYTVNIQLYNYVYNEKRLVTFNGESGNVTLNVAYGESLGYKLFDAEPIPREVADGIYFKYWYFIKNGKEVKVNSETIFTENLFAGETITLLPKLYSNWTPNY